MASVTGVKRVALYVVLILPILTPQSARTEVYNQSEPFRSVQKALSANDIDEAMLELKLALQDDPLNSEAHYALGVLLAKQGAEDQAMVGFQRTIALDPTHPKALHNLGTLLLWQGQAVAAAELLERAILYDPDYIPPYNSLAKAYYSVGVPELALSTYKEALNRDAENPIASENLALLVAASDVEPKEDEWELGEAQAESSENKKVDALAKTDYTGEALKLSAA